MIRFIASAIMIAFILLTEDATWGERLEGLRRAAGTGLAIWALAFIVGWGWFSAQWEVSKRAHRERAEERREEAKGQ